MKRCDLDKVLNIVEGRLIQIEQVMDPSDYDDGGWWVIGHCYMFLYHLLLEDDVITDTGKDFNHMVELVVRTAGLAAITYREYSNRIDTLDPDEEGFFALIGAFLHLYKAYVDQRKSKLN